MMDAEDQFYFEVPSISENCKHNRDQVIWDIFIKLGTSYPKRKNKYISYQSSRSQSW